MEDMWLKFIMLPFSKEYSFIICQAVKLQAIHLDDDKFILSYFGWEYFIFPLKWDMILAPRLPISQMSCSSAETTSSKSSTLFILWNILPALQLPSGSHL